MIPSFVMGLTERYNKMGRILIQTFITARLSLNTTRKCKEQIGLNGSLKSIKIGTLNIMVDFVQLIKWCKLENSYLFRINKVIQNLQNGIFFSSFHGTVLCSTIFSLSIYMYLSPLSLRSIHGFPPPLYYSHNKPVMQVRLRQSCFIMVGGGDTVPWAPIFFSATPVVITHRSCTSILCVWKPIEFHRFIL